MGKEGKRTLSPDQGTLLERTRKRSTRCENSPILRERRTSWADHEYITFENKVVKDISKEEDVKERTIITPRRRLTVSENLREGTMSASLESLKAKAAVFVLSKEKKNAAVSSKKNEKQVVTTSGRKRVSKRVRKEANVDKKQGKISTFFPPSMTPTKEEHADNVDGK